VPVCVERVPGNLALVMGSGGERRVGHLFRLDLRYQCQVAKPTFELRERWRVSGKTLGMISSPLLLPPEPDRHLLLATSFDGRLLGIEFETGDILFELSFPGTQTYVMPVPFRWKAELRGEQGMFGAVACFSGTNPWTGLNFPDNHGRVEVAWVDLAAARLVNRRRIGHFIASSPATADLNGDGADETIVTFVKFLELGEKEVFHYLTIYDGASGAKLLHRKFFGLTASTPSLADLEGNGLLDLVLANELGVFRFEIQNSRGHSVTWGGYLGPLQTAQATPGS
jgi:hypothetical protein